MKEGKVQNSKWKSINTLTSLLALGLIFSFERSIAQYGSRFKPPGEEDFTIGIHIGAGLNGLNFDKIAPLPGANAVNHLEIYYRLGLFGQFRIAPKMILGGEVNLATRPGKITFDNGSYSWKHDYIELPFMFNYSILEGFKIYGGLQPGVLLKASITRIFNAPLPFLDSTTNLYSTYKPLVLSGVLGINYQINEDFSVDIRLTQSLLSLAKLENPYNGLKIKAAEISLYYNLPTGAKSSQYLRY